MYDNVIILSPLPIILGLFLYGFAFTFSPFYVLLYVMSVPLSFMLL